MRDSKPMVGSKIPVNINIDGLGDNLKLSDSSVQLEATFFCKRITEYEGEVPASVTYQKSTMVPAAGSDGNDYVCMVDTSTLGWGRLSARVKVTYPSGMGTGVPTTEVMLAETDVELYEMGM